MGRRGYYGRWLFCQGNCMPFESRYSLARWKSRGIHLRWWHNEFSSWQVQYLETACCNNRSNFCCVRSSKHRVHQCSLSIKKREQLMIGRIQTVLGLTVDTNKLTVAITQEYWDQVKELLMLHWPISRRIFKVSDIQKLIGKLAWLGKGVPWIYKIMLHIYTSLAFALKQNKELLLVLS